VNRSSRGWGVASWVASWSASTGTASGWATSRTALRSTLRLAAIDNVVAAEFQSFFSFLTDTTIAIAQSNRQSLNNFVAHAAAAVLANLVTNLISSFVTNAFVAIIQSVGKRTHNLGIANAAVLVAELINRTSTIFRIASCLRCIDQLSNLAGIIAAHWL
jgi:hypothetical protein